MTTSALVPTYATYPFEILRGNGVEVYDAQNRAYLDLYGGHAVATLGHTPTTIAAALAEQARTLFFYSNVARTPIRDTAARALADFSGLPGAQVFFCNSGTEANEAALKTALQVTKRAKIAALAGAFHGRTLLSLSATDGASYRGALEPLLVPCVRLRPNVLDDVALLDHSIAALIVEPIQSMAGVVVLEPTYLAALRTRTRELGIALIFDEVQTGIGRLGQPFAATAYHCAPDMITTAKGLGGGFPVGAVIFSADIAATITTGALGSTFGGGPLACAAVAATLATIHADDLLARVRRVSAYAREHLCVGPVTGIRGDGFLLGLETTAPAKDVYNYLLERRILTGTSAHPDVLRLLPPLILEETHIDQLATALREWRGSYAT